jgi:3-dehydroquinate synthase
LCHIPTTILAQSDASIGGKTAVNTEAGKNIIGTFYHPEFVLADTSFLATLDDYTYFEGFAEIIKYALIRDRGLFEYLENTGTEELKKNITDIIRRCARHKAEIVSGDEKDSSKRLALNFGHTLAHAIEKHYNYELYSHPRAVAMGIYNTVLICEKEGITKKGTSDRIKKLFEKLRLECDMPRINNDNLCQIIANDKKAGKNGLKLTIIRDIGSYEIIRADIDYIKIMIDKYFKEQL